MTHATATRLTLALVVALFFTQLALPANAMQRVDDPGDTSPAAAAVARPAAAAAFPQVASPDPVIAWMAGQVDQDALYQRMGDLTGEWLVTVRGNTTKITTRNTNSGSGIQNATNYVYDHLQALELTMESHRWGPTTAPNIIGQKTGKTAPGDIYMITAHLDDMPTGSTAPGADDNASGSVSVLVAADILSQFEWNCTLRFALWTGEEQGLLGSDKYAQRAKNNGETIKGALNLDMIAWNTAGSAPDVDLNANKNYPATVDLANQMASVIDAYDFDLVPEILDYGEGASDHASFWKYGYTAILGIEDYYPNDHDFDPYYHKTTDKLSTLNMPYFTEFVKAAVAETAHMSGCLVTGAAQGRVIASHDGSGVAGAEIALTDATGRTYRLTADAAGGYSQAVPPGTYSGIATAYGYDSASATGVTVTANGSVTANFTLTASVPAAPTAAAGLDTGEAKLSWPHLGPDTSYTVLRSAAPYFDPAAGATMATIPAAYPPAADETLTWRDADSGVGDAAVNHFYVVVGQNAAGVGAASNRTGEFDFVLTKP